MTRPDARPPDPGTWLLDRLDTREQALTRQIEQTQTDIDSLTARLSELSQEAEHLRISRKTLLSSLKRTPLRPNRMRRRWSASIIPTTSRSSPASARPAARCAPATWLWRWTCP
jgi:septal ring factor EnvC (AmiA/AmiB activator)